MAAMDENGRFNGRKNRIWFLFLCLSLAAAVLGCAGWGICRHGRAETEQGLEELSARIEETERDGDEPPSEETTQEPGGEPEEPEYYAELRRMGIPVPDKEIDFERLITEENPDIYAWIYLPDSLIDYPVLQHPTDNVFYLQHNLDGSKGYPGCIYSENYNAKDFSDPNTVLYGHNMKVGIMFAGLHQFEDETYFEEHPYVYIYMPDKLYVYEVFAAYEFGNQHLLLNYDFTDKTVFQEFLDNIADVCSADGNIREGVEVTADDRVLTLSTCVQERPDNRFLVHGVLLNGED